MRILALLCVLSLGGCAELAATLINDSRAGHDAVYSYIAQNNERRREVRRLCWELLQSEVEKLKALGDYDGARTLLRANYPPLVGVTLVRKALDDPSTIGKDVPGCDIQPISE